MAQVTGTIRCEDDGTTKTLTIVDTPDVVFIDPPLWAWDLCKGNAKVEGVVTYDAGPPKVITKVKVG